MTNGDRIREFFTDRPSINIESFCQEAGVSASTIRKIIEDTEREPQEKTYAAVKSLMIYYGYEVH